MGKAISLVMASLAASLSTLSVMTRPAQCTATMVFHGELVTTVIKQALAICRVTVSTDEPPKAGMSVIAEKNRPFFSTTIVAVLLRRSCPSYTK